MNHVVITADDFGLSPEVNDAVETAHRSGILSAASLMVASPGAVDAVVRTRRMPNLRVGLHLVLVEARPACAPDMIPDLVDRNGFLRIDLVRLGIDLATRAEVRAQSLREITAQFEAYRATGLPLDHVNAHKHFHLHPVIAAQIMSVGRRYGMRALRVPLEPGRVLARIEPSAAGVPFTAIWAGLLRARTRRAGLTVPDAVFGLRWSGAMSASRLRALIGALPPGLNEIYLHPATADAFAGSAPGYRYVDELAALCDPGCAEALRTSGHKPGGYGDVV